MDHRYSADLAAYNFFLRAFTLIRLETHAGFAGKNNRPKLLQRGLIEPLFTYSFQIYMADAAA
jgi:hypothetical protein